MHIPHQRVNNKFNYPPLSNFYFRSKSHSNFKWLLVTAELIRPYARKDTACSWIPFQDFGNLQKIGTLFSPTPALTKLAWQRRHLGNRAYILIGLAHSLSHYLVQDALAELVIGPMEPWDALVCPWQSSKTAILRELAAYGDYLAERFSIPDKIRLGLQLPVIHPFVRAPEQIDKQIGLEN